MAKEEPNPFAAEIAARGTNAFISPDTNLRDLLKQYDFRNITPLQLEHLGNELFPRGGISEEANSNFGVANDINDPMLLDKPIDVTAHFQFMSDALENAELKDPSGKRDYAATNVKHLSKTFEDILSFVGSDRKAISTHQEEATIKGPDEIQQRMRVEAALFLIAHPPKIIIG